MKVFRRIDYANNTDFHINRPSLGIISYLSIASKQYFCLYSVDDNRIYGYVRVETGDELSKRAKFVLITWIGPKVSPLKKAKVSTDKAFLKETCPVRLTTFNALDLCPYK